MQTKKVKKYAYPRKGIKKVVGGIRVSNQISVSNCLSDIKTLKMPHVVIIEL